MNNKKVVRNSGVGYVLFYDATDRGGNLLEEVKWVSDEWIMALNGIGK